MDLGNSVKTIMYHILIGGMICLDCRDGFPMMSALVYVMHTRQPTVNHDARLSIVMIHQATILHELSTLIRS